MIRVEEIDKSYGDTKVFEHFSCTISFEEQVMTAIMGPSGSGKTTLLRMIAGLERPDQGHIIGVPDKVGMVFQEPRLFLHMSALENVSCVSNRAIAEQILVDLKLKEALDKKAAALSGGMQQRVAIARALACGRDLILFDEPFKGLHEELKYDTIQCVRKYMKNGIIITHDIEEAKAFSAPVISVGDR
ncbi:MAG: ATP-binding cassette domain-containing protein [Clostridiales bacterium]|nr:ATP-binding cassette domain-containing protein [Clostridiales bacterium]